jgi:molybdate transport system permease protein
MDSAAADFAAVWLTLKLATIVTLLLLDHRYPHRLVAGAHALGLKRHGRRYCGAAAGAAADGAGLLPADHHGAKRASRATDAIARPRPAALHLPRLGHRLSVLLLPFVVQPIQNAFEAIGERPLEVAATLRASPWDTFWSVAVPLAKPGFLSGAILGFAHTVGEFGIVLMIGGNIPDKTRVVSVQIYDHVEALEYTQAHWLAGGMVLFSFLVLLGLYTFNPARRKTL